MFPRFAPTLWPSFSLWPSSFIHTGINIHLKPECEAKYEIGRPNHRFFGQWIHSPLTYLTHHGLDEYWVRMTKVRQSLKGHTIKSLYEERESIEKETQIWPKSSEDEDEPATTPAHDDPSEAPAPIFETATAVAKKDAKIGITLAHTQIKKINADSIFSDSSLKVGQTIVSINGIAVASKGEAIKIITEMKNCEGKIKIVATSPVPSPVQDV
jgi:hypothetical protein